MVSRYLDGTVQEAPSDAAISVALRIVETGNPRHWSKRQEGFADWYFRHARADGTLPASVPMDDLPVELGYIHKLVLGRGGTDLQYRIYGGKVAAIANLDMQGRWVSEHRPPHCDIFLDHYLSLIARPRLFVGQVEFDGVGVKSPRWHRADVPFGSDSVGVTGIIAMAIPDR
ncbi:hypothetical protein [Pacificispira sp.]|uniref:hypothetical protein n=1 Tax=Pacificispira sp. TaxID=2888761 RepID=UPI003BA904F6